MIPARWRAKERRKPAQRYRSLGSRELNWRNLNPYVKFRFFIAMRHEPIREGKISPRPAGTYARFHIRRGLRVRKPEDYRVSIPTKDVQERMKWFRGRARVQSLLDVSTLPPGWPRRLRAAIVLEWEEKPLSWNHPAAMDDSLRQSLLVLRDLVLSGMLPQPIPRIGLLVAQSYVVTSRRAIFLVLSRRRLETLLSTPT